MPLTDGTTSLYADDVMLYHAIRTASDYFALHVGIDNLCAWTDDNLLMFNAIKCKYTINSRKRQPALPVSPIMVKDTCLERVDSYRYLGVWLTSVGPVKSQTSVIEQGGN